MLNPNQIVRFIDSRNHRMLVDRVLVNGRCHSRLARSLLEQPEIIGVSALGLGLQRVCELAYWAVPEGAELAHRLIRTQRRDGLFVAGTSPTTLNASHLMASTAVAARGLIDWRSQFQHRDEEAALLDACISRALNALAAACRSTATADSAALAVVLWQLGDCEQACLRIPLGSIRDSISHASPAFLRDDLPRLALTRAA